MNINCIFCHSPVKLKKEYIWMTCMCDDEFRSAPLNEIKMGFHSDFVYLLEKSTKGIRNEKENNNACEEVSNCCR